MLILDRDKLKALLRAAIERAPKAPGRPATEIKGYLGDAYLDGLVASAIEKFGRSDDVARLNAVHAVLPIGRKTRVVTISELEEFPGRKTVVINKHSATSRRCRTSTVTSTLTGRVK